jgi:hypothetical protein
MRLRRNDFPLESDRALVVDFFNVKVYAAGASETLVARLSAEDGEAKNLHSALDSVWRDSPHFRAFERLDRRRFAGLEAKP